MSIFIFICVHTLSSVHFELNHPWIDLQSVQQVVMFLVLEMSTALELFYLRFFHGRGQQMIYSQMG